ncbi:MAG: MaoC family dehydratase, partial [Pseudomonadota bacterium]|nr:MaoC family dehydratase [Pseudomonadota bacterium]
EFAEVAGRAMTPEAVTLFSSDVGNLLHFDPDFAQAMGFRAPIAQGLMAMAWMMGEMACNRPPRTFDVICRFRRPVFWDDTIRLQAAPGVFRVMTPAGKPAAELTVNALTY